MNIDTTSRLGGYGLDLHYLGLQQDCPNGSDDNTHLEQFSQQASF
jgi:hypothetical protein